jgi:putative isomerase
MLLHATVPLSRAWNTWSMRPAEMVFLPLGVRIAPILYSTRTQTTSEISPRENTVRLGRHDVGGTLVELETEHAGTRLRFAFAKPDPFIVCGRWEGGDLGEWGLRFWVTLAISAEGGEIVRHDAANGVAIVQVGSRFVAVATAEAPVQVTGHDSIADLRRDFECNSYFHLASRSGEAPVLGLRFNLEMMRRGAYAAAVADTVELAAERAKEAVASSAKTTVLPAQTGAFDGALDAISDIVAWNTIWDETNARPYTAVSRIWNLGKFAVWFNDQTFAALLSGLFDTDLARENMAAALAGAAPDGNIACLITSNDAWVDRSQPPLGAFTAWLLYLRAGERSLLETSYEALARNQRWWRRYRDPDGRGLVSCGTSAVGSGLYAGTAFGARNETGMDNSATHDEAVYDPATRTLSTFDLGLNCALALDAEMLANIALVLGRADAAAEFAQAADASRRLISETLWDEERGIFAGRQRNGGFVRSVSPTSFYPLFCGAASKPQARRLLDHLADPETFGGPFMLPNATRNDPAFRDNVYWRGRIWPNVNFMVWQGLRRYGFLVEASSLAENSHSLFMAAWRERRIAAENYNASTGEPMDQPDTDPFYIWAGLLPLMAVGEISDIDPWQGWTIANSDKTTRLGPVASPAGLVSIVVERGVVSLERGGSQLLSTDFAGRLCQLRLESGLIACRLERRKGSGGLLRFPSTSPSRIVAVRLDGVDVAWTEDGAGIAVDLGAVAERANLSVHLTA